MSVRFWIFSAILPLAMLTGCGSKTASNPSPPRLEEPVVLEEQASTIHIPVSFPLDDLQARINQEIPRELVRIDEPQQVCVKTKSKLLPDISCRLVGSVTRGPIRLRGKGSDLLLTMPVTAVVSAQHIGKIIKQETATGSIQLTAKIKLGLRPDWTPTAKVTADYDWTNRLGIDFLGQRIKFSSKVDPKLHEILAGLERSLPRELTKLQLREKVQPLWAKGFTAIRVKTEPLIWVRFTPEQVGFSGYEVHDRRVVVGFSGRAKTETIFGPRPADPPITPLPRLMGALPARGINVHVPVIVRYDVLEREARKALISDDYRSVEIKGGKVDAQFHDISIYGTPDNRLALGINMSLKTLGGAISATGTVWFVARPVLDIPGRTVSISDVVVSGQTDNQIFNMLLDAVNATTLRQRIIEVTRYDFTNDYNDGLKKADAWLTEQPFEGFVFKGDLGGADIKGVRIAPDGLLVEVDARATAGMTYDPARAKVLVNKRHARRAARLAAEKAKAEQQAAAKAKGAN